jgi:hypothetical protein
VLLLGFVIGAALVLLTDSDSSGPSVVSTPAGGGGSGSTAGSDAAAASAGSAGVTDVNGQHVHGVKAQDVAAEAQPDVPLDAPTRALVAQQLSAARTRCSTRRSPTRPPRATTSPAGSRPAAAPTTWAGR